MRRQTRDQTARSESLAFRTSRVPVVWLMIVSLILNTCPQGHASDHGDHHIGDFFVFERHGKLVMALTVQSESPGEVGTFAFPTNVVYQFLIDRDAEVRGGTILKPESIKEDVVFEVSFPNPYSQPHLSVRGLSLGDDTAVANVLLFTGLRDDPFIRRPLAGKNIGAIVVEVPMHVVEEGKILVLWATASDKDGKMLDLSGQPYGSQGPGKEKLNTTHPSEHTKLPNIQKPDVLMYDVSSTNLFPNGRKLEDDVVNILGLENTLPNEQPSPATNDVAFLPKFPYLAPPHDPSHAEFERNAPKQHVHMRVRELSRFDLGRELKGLGGRDARLRFWLMDPGGTIRFHKHAERPAMVYLLTGEVEESKWGVQGTKTIKAGEVAVEAADTEHYWINKGQQAVTMAAVDLVDAFQERLPPPDTQALPRQEWDVSKSEADAKAKEAKSGSFKLLGDIKLRDAIAGVPEVYNYVMRAREISMKAGEMISLQKHAGRPSITYVIQGVIVEYRDDRNDVTDNHGVPLGVPLRAGDFTINANGVSRWLINTADQEARVFEIDFYSDSSNQTVYARPKDPN